MRVVLAVLCLLTAPAVADAASSGSRQVRPLDPSVARKLPPPKKLYDRRTVLGGREFIPMDAGQPPLLIETNVGQAARGFPFVARGVNFAVGFAEERMIAVVARTEAHGIERGPKTGHAINLQFRGARPTAVVGDGRLRARANFVRGRDPLRQRRRATAFRSVVYRELYPGLQLAVTGKGGKLEYGFTLEPRARLSDIVIDVKGVTSLEIDAQGNLRMNTGEGTIVQGRPRFTETRRGAAHEVPGRFVLLGKTSYGFAVERRTPGARLDIDPEIMFSTYYGGSKKEGTLESDGGASDLHGAGFDIAVGANANAYIVGTTLSTDFPTDVAGPVSVSRDLFAMRLDPALPAGDWVVYSTVLGGGGVERGVAVAPTPNGKAYITGCTDSEDFPTSPGVVQPTRKSSVGYVVRLAADGAFELGTFIGRDVVHHPASIGYADGAVYLAGSVAAPPDGVASETVGGFQGTYKGGAYDGFLAKLDAGLTHYEYLTLLGGSGRDIVRDLAVADGHAYVTGATTSIDFPTTPYAFRPTHSQAGKGIDCTGGEPRECFDAFVTRVQPDGAALVYSTFYGVSAANREEYGRGIAVGSDKRATITGGARSTTGGDAQIIVARFDGMGDNVTWQKQLAGLGTDHGEEVVVDALNRAHVVGTSSKDGLATGEGAGFHGGKGDIFYARLDGVDGAVEYLTYLGGSGEDRGFAVAAEGLSEDNFCAWTVGSTTSQDVATIDPVPGGEERRGGADVLVHLLCDKPFDLQGAGSFHKYPDNQVVVAGDTVEFTITVVNDSDTPGWVTITDKLPSALTLLSVESCGDCSLSAADNSFECHKKINPGAQSCFVKARAAEKCWQSTVNRAKLIAGDYEKTSNAAKVEIRCTEDCPNGEPDPGEKCDDGNTSNSDACLNTCEKARCGDGFLRSGVEECDDGNTSNADNCSKTCKPTVGAGGSCEDDAHVCRDGLVCGKRCVEVVDCAIEIFGWCIGKNENILCTSWKCMKPESATYTK